MLTPLNRLLEIDPHLAATCLDAYKLASALQVLCLGQLANADAPWMEQDNDPMWDRLTDHLVALLFEEEYVRRIYFRFYNLEMDESPVLIGPRGASLRRLPDWEIPAITGELTPTSTLHLPNTGNVFLVYEDRDPQGDVEWWGARWQEATVILSILKYVKYAVIDIDYSVAHFSPDWVNRVRRYGIAMWGRPRVDTQNQRYILGKGDDQVLRRYLRATERFSDLFGNVENTMRRGIATAARYYEGHHKRAELDDQLVDLVIAFESLLSTGDGRELRFRVSHRAALLLGGDAEERKVIAAFLRKLYDGRSRLVHAGASPFIEARLSAEDVHRLGDHMRDAILRLLVLYARGERDRDRALNRIEESAYDPESLTDLRNKTDVESFLRESGLP